MTGFTVVGGSQNRTMQEIPQYQLDDSYRNAHREPGDHGSFGYNNLDPSLRIPGFEMYSSQGMTKHIGPLRSEFYRIGITLRGTCDVQLGLEHFSHRPGTVNGTFPHQIFSKSNIRDIFGYYLLFDTEFLNELISDARIAEEFGFFSYEGMPFFQLDPQQLDRVVQLVLRIDDEVCNPRPGRAKAVRLNLYLMLLELKRSYDATMVAQAPAQEPAALATRFRRLVGRHYLEKQQVADYAGMLFITPNHLNRVIREVCGRTASALIDEMILQEAKVLLLHTDLSMSEISYRLSFSEPSAFNRFFKRNAGTTPATFRSQPQ